MSVCFLESTGSVKSAGDPISGPRLLFSVPGALGLEKNNCNEVLPERLPQASTETIDARAHRICDDRYAHFRGSFGFGLVNPFSTGSALAMRGPAYTRHQQSSEAAVGLQDLLTWFAIFNERQVSSKAEAGGEGNAKRFNLKLQPALRELTEPANGCH